MSNVIRKLKEWTHQQLTLEDEDLGDLKRLTLIHLNLANKSADITVIKVTKKTDPASAATKLYQTAEDDASGMGGVQKYAVLAFFGESERPGARFPFRVSVESEDGESPGGDSEPATKGGLIAQQMRHNEALLRLSTMSTGEVIRQLTATIEKQYERIEALENRHFESLEMTEKLLSEQHKREIETAEFVAKEERMSQLVDKLQLIAPVVVNKLMGKNVLPAPYNPATEGIKALMESLTPDQFDKLQQVLKPEQLISVLQVYESFREPEKKALPASTNGAS